MNTNQSTHSTKQYWNYTIPERVKYATGKYFTTLKDDPHHPVLTEAEIESLYATGIQWGDMLMPVSKDIERREAFQLLLIVIAVADYKISDADYEGIQKRDLKMFGQSINELLRVLLSNLSNDLYEYFFEEFYWYTELSARKISGKSDALQGLMYKGLATNIDTYLTLRATDILLSFSFIVVLCCNTDEKINELPEWHNEYVEIGIWAYDAVCASKHRAELEPCDLSRYIDGGMPDSVTNMLEYARQKIWHLTEKYGRDLRYHPYRALMHGLFAMGYMMYRYRHIEFLGPVLAKNTEQDNEAISNEDYAWYKVEQDGGVLGAIRKYKEAVTTKNVNDVATILNERRDINCKKVMRAVLAEDIKKYSAVDFPIAKDKNIKI